MIMITMGGRPRAIRFEFETIEAAEAQIGEPLRGLVLNQRGLTIHQIVRILWAVLSRDIKGLGIGKVRDWLKDYVTTDGGNLLQVETAILDALLETDLVIPRNSAGDQADAAEDPPTGPDGSQSS